MCDFDCEDERDVDPRYAGPVFNFRQWREANYGVWDGIPPWVDAECAPKIVDLGLRQYARNLSVDDNGNIIEM